MATKPDLMPQAALALLENQDLTPTLVDEIRGGFNAAFDEIEPFLEVAQTLEIKSSEDTAGMALAKETRLGLRRIRINVEKERKRLKAGALSYGRAVDGIANILKFCIEPAEASLLEAEQFAEREEEARRNAINAERTEQLQPFAEVLTPGDTMGLADLSDEQWEALLASVEQRHADHVEAQQLLLEKRAAAEKAKKEEVERLKKERDQAMAEANKERAARNAEAVQRAKENAALREAQLRADEKANRAAKAAAAEKAKMEAELQRIREEQDVEIRVRYENERAESLHKEVAAAIATVKEIEETNAARPASEKLESIARQLSNISYPTAEGMTTRDWLFVTNIKDRVEAIAEDVTSHANLVKTLEGFEK